MTAKVLRDAKPTPHRNGINVSRLAPTAILELYKKLWACLVTCHRKAATSRAMGSKEKGETRFSSERGASWLLPGPVRYQLRLV